MAKHDNIVVAVAALLCQACFASATLGTATFFREIAVSSQCHSTETGSGVEIGRLGETVYAAKASAAVWDGGAACGKTYCVVCAGATDPRKPSPCGGKSSIYVTVRGLCSDCEATISISIFGFAAIVAHPDADGIINIEYQPADSTKSPCA